MCPPGCRAAVSQLMSRRDFLTGSAGAVALGVSLPLSGCSVSARSPSSDTEDLRRSFSRVIDLTHTLTPDFPTFSGAPALVMEDVARVEDAGYNVRRWTLTEHVGTHIDSPFHFSSTGATADELPITNLVVPLCIVDIRDRAATDPDYQLTVEDIKRHEMTHGTIPPGACVALMSGWDTLVATMRFRNADPAGVLHFPGFHPESADFLIERQVAGVATDTLSLDHGASKDFAVHKKWLPTNHWGIECIAHLAELPPSGATLVAGAPKVRGATGGPSRVIALLP